jgi:hypothetical protein
MPSVEKRLVIWSGVPSGSTFHLQVTPGDYAVTASVSLETATTGPTIFNLGPAQLVDNEYTVPIEPGTVLKVELRLTYIFAKQTTGTVNARVTRADGSNYQNAFTCDYTGALGSDSPEDGVLIVAAGGKPGGGK